MDLDDLEPPSAHDRLREKQLLRLSVQGGLQRVPAPQHARPKFIDLWNVDIDYLSARTNQFPALGSEMGWFGTDLIRDLKDPYHEDRNPQDHFTKSYFGYFDIWGLKERASTCSVPVRRS